MIPVLQTTILLHQLAIGSIRIAIWQPHIGFVNLYLQLGIGIVWMPEISKMGLATAWSLEIAW